jgi:glycosyltransferase involved in cell wall biosynthesis
MWGQRKGYNDILMLAELLPEYQIVIVGISSRQANTLPSSIIGIERTDSVEELVKIYSAADVFVNPTYEDNFPTVNLEALACGTPVITYDTGGSPECIDESCGIVVEKGNISQMSNMILPALAIPREKCMYASTKFSQLEKYQNYYNLFET